MMDGFMRLWADPWFQGFVVGVLFQAAVGVGR